MPSVLSHGNWVTSAGGLRRLTSTPRVRVRVRVRVRARVRVRVRVRARVRVRVRVRVTVCLLEGHVVHQQGLGSMPGEDQVSAVHVLHIRNFHLPTVVARKGKPLGILHKV